MGKENTRYGRSPRRYARDRAACAHLCSSDGLCGARSCARNRPGAGEEGGVLKATAPKLTIHTPVTPVSGYLALGDSVPSGYEEQQVVPAPNYSDASSFIGYPEDLGAELHLTVANAACPGETSSSLINPSAQSNGCETFSAAARRIGRCSRYT